MNTLVLTRNPIYPPTNGEQRRVWEECKHFSTYGEVLVASPDAPSAYPHDSIRPVELNSSLITSSVSLYPFWNASHVFGRFNGYPRVLSQRIVRILETRDLSFDLVVSEFPQMDGAAARLANRHDSTLLLSKHNAAHVLLDGFLAGTSLPRLVRESAVQGLYAYEQSYLDRADAVVFQSDADRARFDIPAGTVVSTIPNGTNYDRIREEGEAEQVRQQLNIATNAFVCLFVGSYDYFANREAATAIIETIAPALPTTTFILVGRNPPETDQPNVLTPGYVDHLPNVLTLADVALCPLVNGAGTKLKMLDYLAAGLPIVTTEVGASGIDIEDGDSALIRDVDKFAEVIAQLKASPERQRRLSENALELGKQYDWSTVLAEYDDVIERLAETNERTE